MKKHSLHNKQGKSIEEALRSILLSDTVGTQEEIKLALEDLGYIVNQSKISRVLHKLGAVKVMNEHKQIVYTLPLEPAPPASRNILSQLIINISMNETMIVIHTNPGSASLIGRLLDHNREELLVLGTVAGDDTVFITPVSIKKIEKTLDAIQSFLAGMR
jgi:transcriptional regulator of arginine metabolism